MKRCLTILAVLLMASSAFATDQPYGWTLSASSTDPNVNSLTPSGGVTTVYLWLACCQLPGGLQQGMSAAEFDIESTGPQVLATTPMNGYLNAGGASNLLLAVGGCPCGPVRAADILIIALPGSLCLTASSATGTIGTVDCEGAPSLYGIDWVGLDLGGGTCGEGSLCEKPISVEDSSWSGIKAMYR